MAETQKEKNPSGRGWFAAGAVSVSPVLAGVLPFALIYGVAASAQGLSTVEGSGMSVAVFAGAAQLAALQLMGAKAPIAVVVLTALVINLRMLMYSAAISPHFSGLGSGRKLVLAYLLTDQAFAVSIARYDSMERRRDKVLYYMGAGLGLWVTWQIGCAAGSLLGASIPPSWSLDFAIPLTFMALIAPVLKDRSCGVAAAAAGVAAMVFEFLPYNSGLMVAAGIGIVAGMIHEGRRP